jgi:beta-galactosidase/beta-glucuronidase
MSNDIPRPEYPRPQFVRPEWQCLNGEWEFEADAGDSGFERGLVTRPLTQRVRVPFCRESALSGIGDIDFCCAVWYWRRVTIPKEWRGRTLLHFQAVDYDATVWQVRPAAIETAHGKAQTTGIAAREKSSGS